MTFRKSSFDQDPMEATGSFTGAFDGDGTIATASLALAVVETPAAQSGVPQTVDGVTFGFTDFSEFATGSGLPSGITEFGIGTSSPTSVSIEIDPEEGKYFKMTGHGSAGYGFGLDAFDQITFNGELLARVYYNSVGEFDWSGGPVFSLSGVDGQPAPTALTYQGGLMDRVIGNSINVHANQVLSGSIGTPLTSAMQEDAQNPAWMWFRVRRHPNVAIPSRDDLQITAWFGDIEDEPSSPDGTTTVVTPNVRFLAAMGWAAVFTTAEQRISYLAFSTDATASAPPVPVAGPSGDFSGSFSGSVTGTFVGELEATGTLTGTLIGSASHALQADSALSASFLIEPTLLSGVPTIINEVAVGFTDFSEFVATGSTRPPGITFFGSGGQPDPTSESIKVDPDEGNYFSIDGHGQSLWAYGVDAFDGQLEFGELLARIWITDAGTNLRDMGPALSITGTLQATTSFIHAQVIHSSPTDFDSNLSRVISGGNGTFTGGALQEAEQENTWAWMRYRRTASANPAFDDMEIRTWYGDIADEPASPDASSLGNFQTTPRGLHAIGWGGFVIPLLEQKVAYLAFSADPVAVPPPVPIIFSGDFSGSFSGSVTGTFVGDSDATGSLTGTFIGELDATGSLTGAFTGTLLGAITGQAAVLAEPWTTTTGSAAGALLPFNANLFTLNELAAHHAALVNELLIVGGQHVVPALLSGVPKEVSSGKFIGGTNFSEFEVSATLPAGLTLYDDGFQGGTPSIENDAIEGNYWAMVGAGVAGRYGIGYDAFFGLSEVNCEILVRTHMTAFNGTNRHFPGPGCNMTGSTDATFQAVLGRLNWAGTPDSSINIQIINPTAGGGSTLASGASSESDISLGDWVWCRMRRQEMPSPVTGNARLKMKVWQGAFSAEPVAWDFETTSESGIVDEDDGAVGWAGDWFFTDPSEHGIAFMSFTNDPEVTAPPTPDEIE